MFCVPRPTMHMPEALSASKHSNACHACGMLQVDISKMESCFGPGQQGVGPSLCASLNAPLPCHGGDPQNEAVILADFPYTPHGWSSKSVTGLTCCDDGWGAFMAQCHEDHQPASTIHGTRHGSKLPCVPACNAHMMHWIFNMCDHPTCQQEVPIKFLPSCICSIV